MNYLITGGTGFLGSHLVKRLLCNAENEVTVVTTSIRDKNSMKMLNIGTDKINLVQGDIRDFEFVRMLFNEYEFDIIFHLAAISEVRKCQNDAKLAFDINIGGTINVLECARLYGNIKAIAVSSSDKAYGTGKIPYVESQSLNGMAVYEASKSCTDIIARSYYNNYRLPVVVTRCSNLYGEGDANFSRLFPNTIRKLVRGESPIIWKGVENATREFLYVDDAVDAYLTLVENIEKAGGEAYNIGGGNILSIKDMVQMIIDKVDKNINIMYKEKDFPEITHQYLDSEKIKREFSWNPKTTFDSSLNKTIRFYKGYFKYSD